MLTNGSARADRIASLKSKRTRRVTRYRNSSPLPSSLPSSKTRRASRGRLDHRACDCLYLALRRNGGHEARDGEPAVCSPAAHEIDRLVLSLEEIGSY
jgi:hypothetical protein